MAAKTKLGNPTPAKHTCKKQQWQDKGEGQTDQTQPDDFHAIHLIAKFFRVESITAVPHIQQTNRCTRKSQCSVDCWPCRLPDPIEIDDFNQCRYNDHHQGDCQQPGC